MENNRCQSIKEKIRNKKGETLVETIVSFVIVLIALAAITSMIRSATAMNVKAQENSDKIEAAAAKIEHSESDGNKDGTMILNFDGKQIELKIDVKTVEPFTYFEMK